MPNASPTSFARATRKNQTAFFARSANLTRRVERWRGVSRFHLPLIEPDGRVSRIRLSDKDDFNQGCSGGSPTEGCVFAERAGSDQGSDTGIRRGSVRFRDSALGVSLATTGGAGS